MSKTDWKETNSKIINQLDIKAECEHLGVQFAKDEPGEGGWLSCYAVDREDKRPSAGVNVNSGWYTDHGNSDNDCSFFDLAARLSGFTDWRDAQKHYAEKVNVELPNSRKKSAGRFDWSNIVSEYSYCDETGNVLYQALRDGNKEFSQRTKVDGEFVNTGPKKNGVPFVPYRLVEIKQSTGIVFIVEGEKDADRLTQAGLTATCNIGGAGKWTKELSPHLAGRDVVILPDNDDPGKKHANSVAKLLIGHAESIRILNLPGIPLKGDVSDWLEDGNTVDELKSLADECEEWTPSEPKGSEADDEPLAIMNCVIFESDEGDIIYPFPMERIIENIQTATGNWPRRVGSALFVESPDYKSVSWLDKADAFMGWLGTATGVPPDFRRSSKCHTPPQVFTELKRFAKAYVAVETLPHEPPMRDHYYTCEFPEPGDGSKLNELVSRYNPETDIDGDLIKAAFVTPFCGLPGGYRPSFLLTADSGRGSGKTTVASHIGQLAGGTLDFSAGEDAAIMKKRLLSSEGLAKRVAILDNVKSNNFGWAEFEAMVTAPTVSGHKLFIGESSRPNNLTWFITLNGASLSKDIAQRCVIVKLAKPKRSGTWAEDTQQFIVDNQMAIIADCIGFLRSERSPLANHTRWASWERAVLERLPEPGEAQKVILERQKAADVGNHESDLIEDYFARQLQSLGYDIEAQEVFIPSAIVTEWFIEATNEKHVKSTGVSVRLNQSINEGTISRLRKNKCNSWGRGFVWSGKDVYANQSVNTDIESRINNATF